MIYKASNNRLIVQNLVLLIFVMLSFSSCNREKEVAVDGDYNPLADSLLSSYPTLNAGTQTVTTADFMKSEILRAISYKGTSNYKFTTGFLSKFKISGFSWPSTKNSSLESFIDKQIPANVDEVLTGNSLKLLNLYDTLRKNCLYLIDGNNFSKIFVNSNITQRKFGYNWGSKQYIKKVTPCDYHKNPNICQSPFFGLDCSGFVYQVFLLSGLDFGNKPEDFANANYFSNPSHYTKVLDKYFGCSSCYKVERINNASYQDLRAGDIIVFQNNQNINIYHIAFCFKKMDFITGADSLTLMESRGNPVKDCNYNTMIERGPKVTYISQQGDRLKGLKYNIIRILVK